MNQMEEKRYLTLASFSRVQNAPHFGTIGITGEVAEWSKAPVSKTGRLEMVSRVRIPPSPPSVRRSEPTA